MGTRSKVYLETTVISYLAAWPSRNVVHAAHQEITREWWKTRDRFDLYVSQLVVAEATRGDAGAAGRRLAAITGIAVLGVTREAREIAGRFLRSSSLPASAEVDALHIAVAVVQGMDFLLTWNCTHIAHAGTRAKIERSCREQGFEPPTICTPGELLEDEGHGT